VAHTKDVFDTKEKGAAHVLFHTKKIAKYKSGNSWAWTFELEKDVIGGLSIRFAPSGTEKDKYMVDLFNKSKLAGVTKKRKASETGVGV